ncbi:MAG: type I-E CRISPR-associated protein Cas5/CasD [Proteobacteria bacterium]|nr:type I-E CRISPR-associated protein Cas5/CasD [Pseudomonadota bacterium]
MDSPGELLRDYHTAQVPTAASLKKFGGASTRREELLADKIKTFLSTRDYRVDAVCVACLWVGGQDPPFTLADLRDDLARPRYVLYLGRKSCPLALPVQAQVVTAANPREAFEQAEFASWPGDLPAARMLGVHWEDGVDAGFEPTQTIVRRDAVVSRVRWQFTNRSEHQAALPGRPDGEG